MVRAHQDGREATIDSIRNRVLIGLTLCGLLPVMIIAVTNKTIIERALEESEFEKYSDLTRELARQVESIMSSAEQNLASLSSNPLVTDPAISPEQRETEMRRLVKIYEMFTDITLYDHTGLMLISTNLDDHPEAVDRTAWLKAAVAGKAAISPPQRVVGSPGLHLSVYLPARGKGQKLPNVLKARLPFDSAWYLLDGASLGDRGRVMLLDGFGNVLADRNKNTILEKFDERYPMTHWRANPSGYYHSPRGDAFAYVAVTLGPGETRVEDTWTVLALIPKEELLAVVQGGSRYQYLAGGLTLLFALVLGLWLARRIASPAIEASEVAQQVARGQMGARIPESGPAEMRRLARAFNQMVEELGQHRTQLETLVALRTRKLQESQSQLEDITAQLRAAFESTREAILMVRHDGVIIAANRRMGEFFGIEDSQLSGRSFSEIRRPLFACFEDVAGFEAKWGHAMEHGDYLSEGEWSIVSPRPRTIASYTAPVRTRVGETFAQLWMFEDVTRERRLQQGLEQAQKMEAIGRLAGGIAHDFNNLLTGIIGNLSLAEMAGGGALEESGAVRYVATAKQAGERAAELVKQLLGFSRRSHLTLECCVLNPLLEEVRELLEHTLDPRIQIVVEPDPDLWGVRADSTQIQQVLMNLCVNSKDALPHGGTIRLATSNVEVAEAEALRHGSSGGQFVRVEVEDDGEGMSPKILANIFEPFFTTKEQGKGTGLGLATSYGIVQQHGGWITCQSEPGVGTRFNVYFPRSLGRAAPAEQATLARPETAQGTETVLLVDDELMVRSVAEGVLRRQGYSIVCASNGLEGVEVVRERGDEIAMVLLDLTMPKLSGGDTFKQIRELYPEMPVVICSGYLLNFEDFEHETGGRPTGFVQKPYDVKLLAEMVRTAIDGTPAPARKASVRGGKAAGRRAAAAQSRDKP